MALIPPSHRGGLEDLLKGVEKHEASLTAGATLADTIAYVKDKMLAGNAELFARGKSV